jgi:hypothetical protein
MTVTREQFNLLSQLRELGSEWGAGYCISLLETLEEEGDPKGELDGLISLHFNNGNPTIYSLPIFEKYSWDVTGLGYPSGNPILIEHLLHAFEPLMSMACLLNGQVNYIGPNALLYCDELVWHWWDKPGSLFEHMASLDKESLENYWPPRHIRHEEISGEMCWSMTFDSEDLPLPQLHAFLRLFIDAYLRGLGIFVEVLALASDEDDAPIAVFFRDAEDGESTLMLSKIYSSR